MKNVRHLVFCMLTALLMSLVKPKFPLVPYETDHIVCGFHCRKESHADPERGTDDYWIWLCRNAVEYWNHPWMISMKESSPSYDSVSRKYLF